MKKILCLAVLVVFFTTASAQQDEIEKLTRPIINEGKALYRSEMASWYGTDVFLEAYKQRENIGGYFSYIDDGVPKCIFYSKTEKPKVIGMISFDDSYNVATAKKDLAEREFTSKENELYTIRKAAFDLMRSDTLFKVYNKSSLNLIPLIENGEKKVYILSGPKENGVVIFGNDYLVSFDKENNVTGRKTLHRNIIPVNYGEKMKEGAIVTTTMHSHRPETGDFITATDICTLMLYAKFAKWEQHIVMSENYVCIWDCNKNELVTLTRKAWEKIYADQKKN